MTILGYFRYRGQTPLENMKIKFELNIKEKVREFVIPDIIFGKGVPAANKWRRIRVTK